uniref:Immunoglobulin (CD79A) binding protein 1b n=1 Tax=Jaculus jaculus TaxID=51337 RepID=A0A8C5L9T7_JACJA
MAESEEELQAQRLPELFESSRQLVEELERATLPSGSRLIQDMVKQGLKLLERAADMLSQLDMFGPNEDLEELASGELRYLLVPAFRGALTLRLANPSKRLEHLRQAREYFEQFLSRCHSYRVPPPSPARNGCEGTTSASGPGAPGLVAMAVRRQEKIQRCLRRKETEQRLSALRDAVLGGPADEERVREFHLLSLRRWVDVSLEELESIDREVRILEQRGCSSSRASPSCLPFVLMRDTAQARVFGLGYPSLATMTVHEWSEQQRQKCAAAPAQEAPQGPETVEQGQASQPEKEQAREDDDDEKILRRAQEWDDWKDTHPRGYGNRQNMG